MNNDLGKAIFQQVEMLKNALPQTYDELLEPVIVEKKEIETAVGNSLHEQWKRVRFLLDHMVSVLSFEVRILERLMGDVDDHLMELKELATRAKNEQADVLARYPSVFFPHVVKRLDVKNLGRDYVFALPPLVRDYYVLWIEGQLKSELKGLNACSLESAVKPAGTSVEGFGVCAEEVAAQKPDAGNAGNAKTEIARFFETASYVFGVDREHEERVTTLASRDRKVILELMDQPFPEIKYSPTIHSAIGRGNLFKGLFAQIRQTSMQTVMPLTVLTGVFTAFLAFWPGGAQEWSNDVKSGVGVAAGLLGILAVALAIIGWVRQNGQQRREALRLLHTALEAREKQVNAVIASLVGAHLGRLIDAKTKTCEDIAAKRKKNLQREINQRKALIRIVQESDTKLARVLG